MKVDVNTVVTLNYSLSDSDTKEHIEATSNDHPMQFLYGIERLLPTFEEEIHGLTAGETAQFTIQSADAYGEHSSEKIVPIPVNVFHDENGKLDEEHIKVGALLPMSDSEGNHMTGRVLTIDENEIQMDFNHPLAGSNLTFDVTILNVREATQDEISHGHTHGEHGHHH
jgi:FKBP-type peptidyl-prolyl cis-trans isomerase SlyD